MKKRLFILFLSLLMVLSVVPISADYSSDFSDVKLSAWYYEAVSYCKQYGYFSGMSDTEFAPKNTLTRAQFVLALANFAGVDTSKEEYTGFSDVKSTAWYYHGVAWAKNHGIVNGTSDTMFAPSGEITRQEICNILMSYIKSCGMIVSGNVEKYNDDINISKWARDGVYFIKKCGIMSGKGEGSFDPKGKTTRAEAAQIIMKLDEFNCTYGAESLGLNNNIVDIKIDGVKIASRFLHISDLHLTELSSEDVEPAVSEETSRGVLFDNETPDGVKRTERLDNMYEFAKRAGCDKVVMTGDIIDTPSVGNLNFFSNKVKNADIETLYCYGNHDWTFTKDYQSSAQWYSSIEKFTDIFGKMILDENEEEILYWDSDVQVFDYDGYSIIAIDNSNDQVSAEAYNTVKNYCDKGIPVVLLCHVPIKADTMTEDVTKMWGRDITLGSDAINPNATTLKFVELLKSADSSVKAIICGHTHLSHTDRISDKNDTMQYVLGASYQGYCATINIHG